MKKLKDREAALWVSNILLELKSNYSELIYPLSLLKFEECRDDKLCEGFATDGVAVYYHPERVIRCRIDELKMQLMHIVVHGLLGHFEIKDEYENKLYRDFLMDVQAEYVLTKMGMKTSHNRFCDREVEKLLQGDYAMSTYRHLCEDAIITSQVRYYYSFLQVDNHEWWDEESKKQNRKACKMLWEGIQNTVLSQGNSGNDAKKAMDHLAKNIVGKNMGDDDGLFTIGTGSGKDYRELLEELIGVREISAEEPDSVDPMLYQYGLEVYGNVPLLEPMEMSLNHEIQTLAIAVDVSGSCTNDEMMRRFWGETYDCLFRLKEYCKEGEVILFQCDDEIEWEQKLDLKELEKVPKEIRVHGYGGTSFVPVFNRLKELEKTGRKVEALFYLTDGQGTYPEEKPDYPVFFIIPEGDEVYCEIPEWINRIKL